MCLHSSIVKSCFSLAKYNNGLFKSEKQGTFLSQLGKTVVSSQTHNLGADYNFKVCGVTDWSIHLDDQGIVKITKRNSKGETVHFERQDQATFEKFKAEKEEKRKRIDSAIEKRDRIFLRIEQLQAIPEKAIMSKLGKGLSLSLQKDYLNKLAKLKNVIDNRVEKLYTAISDINDSL